MAADAKYGVVQARRGVMGDAYVHWSLPRIVGMANAAEILLTGRTFDGAEMQRLGVASRCLPTDEVLPAAWESPATSRSTPRRCRWHSASASSGRASS